jgi:hypothetical protein
MDINRQTIIKKIGRRDIYFLFVCMFVLNYLSKLFTRGAQLARENGASTHPGDKRKDY